jgi:hypothetical protein
MGFFRFRRSLRILPGVRLNVGKRNTFVSLGVRHATTDANRVLIHWADLYRELLTSVAALASDTTVADTEVRDRLRSLVAEHRQRKPPIRAQLVRDHLTLEVRPVRSLLSALMVLPWEATPGHPVLAAVQPLKPLDVQVLPVA